MRGSVVQLLLSSFVMSSFWRRQVYRWWKRGQVYHWETCTDSRSYGGVIFCGFFSQELLKVCMNLLHAVKDNESKYWHINSISFLHLGFIKLFAAIHSNIIHLINVYHVSLVCWCLFLPWLTVTLFVVFCVQHTECTSTQRHLLTNFLLTVIIVKGSL